MEVTLPYDARALVPDALTVVAPDFERCNIDFGTEALQDSERPLQGGARIIRIDLRCALHDRGDLPYLRLRR